MRRDRHASRAAARWRVVERQQQLPGEVGEEAGQEPVPRPLLAVPRDHVPDLVPEHYGDGLVRAQVLEEPRGDRDVAGRGAEPVDVFVTPCSNTPAVGPDTPDMEFLVHVIFVLWAPQPLKTISLSLSQLIPCLPLLSLPLTPSRALNLPKP